MFEVWYTDSKYTVKSAITAIPEGSFKSFKLYAKWKKAPVGSVTRKVNRPVGEYIDVTGYTAKYSKDEEQKDEINQRIAGRTSGEYWAMSDAVPDDGNDDYKSIRAAVVLAGMLYEERGTEELVKVYVPAGVYNIEINGSHPWGLQLEAGVDLIMDNDAILKFTVANDFDQWFYPVSVADMHDGHIENVSIRGGQIYGVRNTFKGSKNKYDGHGIGIVGATNVTISDMQIYDNYGDGIYVGTKEEWGTYYGCKNVNVSYCDIFDNRRNNISIVDADNMTVDHCNIYNAHGASPECGIIIEPNFNSNRDAAEARCSEISITNSVISAASPTAGTDGNGNLTSMSMYTNYNPYDKSYCVVDGLYVENCSFFGHYGIYSGRNYYEENNTYEGAHVIYDFVSWVQ